MYDLCPCRSSTSMLDNHPWTRLHVGTLGYPWTCLGWSEIYIHTTCTCTWPPPIQRWLQIQPPCTVYVSYSVVQRYLGCPQTAMDSPWQYTGNSYPPPPPLPPFPSPPPPPPPPPPLPRGWHHDEEGMGSYWRLLHRQTEVVRLALAEQLLPPNVGVCTGLLIQLL